MSGLPAVFDGHNDTLLRLYLAGGGIDPFFAGRSGHLDLPKARMGGFGGGFFAIFVPSPTEENLLAIAGEGRPKRKRWSRDDAPYSPAVGMEESVRVAGEVIDLAERLVEESDGQLRWMRAVEDIDAAEAAFAAGRLDAPSVGRNGPLRLVLHFEGAEPIAPDLSNLDHWLDRGLRSLGLVWSRRNAFGAGVPFRYPSTPDHFDGLTAAGCDLVKACEAAGVLIDLSHINEKGFWDVSRITAKPLIVTHAGALRVCPSSRNLTDDQIRAVADSDGVIGVNLHCGDLRPDGRLNSETSLELVAQHIDAMVELAGPRHVALGSDFDGALMPRSIGDASGLPALLQCLRDRGWCDEDLSAFAFGNWLRALRTAWES